MIHLDLDSSEEEEFGWFLEAAVSDLAMEISSTDRLDFRTILKRRRAVLHKVLRSVGETRQMA